MFSKFHRADWPLRTKYPVSVFAILESQDSNHPRKSKIQEHQELSSQVSVVPMEADEDPPEVRAVPSDDESAPPELQVSSLASIEKDYEFI